MISSPYLHISCPTPAYPSSMTQFFLHKPPITRSSSTFSALSSSSCSFNPHKKPTITRITIPATDRVIDFGRHKGKMLGTIPSSYLKWVSKNLRAQDSEHWAKLADQVLEDPVYRDRIEWELAENLLTGNKNMATNESSVSQLLELSERFGWDNDDKVGWSKVNFELLGTTKGGRIPRMLMLERKEEKKILKVEKEKEVGLLTESEEKRRERRIRVKEKMGRGRIGIGNGNGDGGVRIERRDPDSTGKIYNPFPGREALLKKVMNRKRFT